MIDLKKLMIQVCRGSWMLSHLVQLSEFYTALLDTCVLDPEKTTRTAYHECAEPIEKQVRCLPYVSPRYK